MATIVLVGYTLADQPEPQRGDPRAAANTLASMQADAADHRPASLWIGDSYTEGVGAGGEENGEACLTADAMGWICNVDAQSGTGFIANGDINSRTYDPLIGRLPDTQSNLYADIVIVDAGRNDLTQSEDKLHAAITRYYAALHRAYPKAPIVQIVPFIMRQETPTQDGRLAAFMETALKPYGGLLIDPMTEGWITPDKVAGKVFSDNIHPNEAGHRYIAKHLTADLRRFRDAPR